MKRKAFSYKSIPNVTVGMQSQQDRNLQVLHGKVLLNEEESRLLFMQNTPRGPRSTELFRTRHSRLVLNPKGTFTLTFRFSADENNLQSSLMSEMETITTNELINRKEDNDEI